MALLEEQFTETLQAGAPDITYEGEEGREQQIAQALWDKLPPQVRTQFGDFSQFFNTGAWKKVLQMIQQRQGSEEIQETLIKAAADLISEETPNYQWVAGRLINYHLRKVVYRSFKPPHISEIARKNVDAGYYDRSFFKDYTTEEIDQLCGSIAVVKPSSFNIPPSADLDYIHDIPWTKYRHRSIFRFFDETKVIRTKERLLTYVLDSGDNFSDRWRIGALARFKATLKPYIKGKKVGLSFKKAFGLS